LKNKIIAILLAVVLLEPQIFANGIIGTPETSNPEDLISCEFKSQSQYYPVGDTSGKAIYTRSEVIRDCNVTTTVQGECVRWRAENTLQSVPTEAYDTYDTNDYSDTIGQLLATTGAYDQMEHLWSGYEGYCVEGTLRDFSWASDPMFWASLAMSHFLSGGELGSVGDAATEGMSEVGEAALTESAKAAAVSAGEEAAMDAAYKATTETIYDKVISEGVKAGTKAALNMGKCLVSATYNLGAATAGYLNAASGEDDPDCNPIDEICQDEESADDGSQSDIQTMDLQAWEDMADSFEASGDNIYDYVKVEDDGGTSGVISFRFIKPSESEGAAKMDNSEMKEIQEKFKQMELAINLGMAAANLSACIYTGGAAGGSISTQSSTKSPESQLLQSGLNSGIDLASSMIPPPAGPIVGAMGKLLVALAMSYSSIDSCGDEDDASEMGSRHEATYKSLKFNLCRPMWDECEDEFAWGECALDGFHFCCYDQLLTRILVEQIKAELGREWRNCTGISIRDLNYVSFEQCTASEMSQGIDGAKAYGMSVSPSSTGGRGGYDGPTWNPEDAFQYKFKCMDLTEFKDFLQDQIGEDIDNDTFQDFWSDLIVAEPI